MITDEELTAIRERASCVEAATSIDDYRKRWREFEQHAIADVNALLAENERLRTGLYLAWSDGWETGLKRPADAEEAIRYRDLSKFRQVKDIRDGITTE
jgi:hypothetical protein